MRQPVQAPATPVGTPPRDTLTTAAENRAMFNTLARQYDRMNRLISLGLDRRWRRRAVACLAPVPGGRYLDIGTGTADLCLEILSQQPDATVVGLDPATSMLALGAEKVAAADLTAQVALLSGDATLLPFADAEFDGIVAGFSIRNVEDRQRALFEMHRVLKAGHRTAILELTTPTSRLFSAGYRLYSATFIPLAAALLTEASAYRYLRRSIAAFPSGGAFLEKLYQAGFSKAFAIPLLGGAATIFVGEKV